MTEPQRREVASPSALGDGDGAVRRGRDAQSSQVERLELQRAIDEVHHVALAAQQPTCGRLDESVKVCDDDWTASEILRISSAAW